MKENKKEIATGLISVLFAIFLWSYVMGATNPTIRREYRNLPVEMINKETLQTNNMVVVEPKNPTINVTLSGPRNEINKVQPRDIIVQVDLARFSSQTQSMPITVQAPRATVIYQQSQNSMVFKFEKIISKEIPVTIETINALPSNHIMLMGTEVKPNRVSITGPSSIVTQIHHAKAQVNLQEIQDDTTLNIPITLVNAEGEQITGVELSQKEVSVSLSINSVKEVPIKLNTVGEPGPGIQLQGPTLNQTTISITGDNEVLNEITQIETNSIDLGSIQETANLNVTLRLPQDVFLSDPSKQIIANVQVVSDKSKTFNIQPEDIELRNVPEGREATILHDAPVAVTIKGSTTAVDAVTDVKTYVDLQEQAPGTLTLPVGVDRIEGVTLDKIEPSEISIRLE
ncbi:MAG: CdaR family protein [Gallicola sp.]|nr:CdaR family protein [Gallicola sp.]